LCSLPPSTQTYPLSLHDALPILSPRLPDGVILAGDSGSVAAWYALHLQLRPGMLASLSGTLATMGSAVPYALAAKLAHPERPVIDRKSTRLNSSHVKTSYAVFCL